MDYYSQAGWLLVALAAIDTGGGGHTGRDVDAGRDYTGRDRISIYADQDAWRSEIARNLDALERDTGVLERENERLRAQVQIMMILIAALFLFGFAATAFNIYKFDLQDAELRDMRAEMLRYFYVRPYPTP